jgi:phosphopantetheine--protein transferase-like protein
LSCGIDVESISALPEADDYWEEPFYHTHFTDAEIAYCVSQSNPRMHFAARWCAKEAFNKCARAHGKVEMNRIEIAHRADGSPFLRLLSDTGDETPGVSISLAHSDDWAVAVVVSTGTVVSGFAQAHQQPLRRLQAALILSLLAVALSGLALALILEGFWP